MVFAPILLKCARFLAALALLSGFSAATIAAPNIVVTIKPIHSLAAAVLAGVATPKLLLDGGASPHVYALKPSDAQAIEQADAVVFVSRNLETFLERSIASLPASARVIELQETPGLTLFSVRGSMAADPVSALDGDEHAHPSGPNDVHFWLDPVNARRISHYLAKQFSEIDPEHAPLYRANAARLDEELAKLDSELRNELGGLSSQPFLVFHDVTQYLERRYGLHGLGAVTLSPERPPGAKRLAQIRQRIAKERVVCVFSEPQFSPKLVNTLIEGTQAKQGALDEIGASLPPGPDQYFEFMRANARSLSTCLKS